MNVWKGYLRWRHSRAYGVHSPYAYRFVKNVVRPGHYGYYAYENIDQFLRKEERDDYKFIRLVRFTIRLSIFLRIKKIIYSKSEERLAFVTAKSLHIPSEELCNDQKYREDILLLIGKGDIEDSELKSLMKFHIPIFAVSPDQKIRQLLEIPLSKGLLINGRHRMILIPRKEMEYVAYDMKL